MNALEAGASPTPGDLAYSLARRAQKREEKPVCAALTAKDTDGLKDLLVLSLDQMKSASSNELEFPPRVNITLDCKTPGPTVAFLFPGQGSHHLGDRPRGIVPAHRLPHPGRLYKKMTKKNDGEIR